MNNDSASIGGAAEAIPLDASIGRKLRVLRKQHGLSLQVMAERLTVSIGYLSQVERGLSTATLKLLAGAADALGVGIADLFGTGDAAAPPKPEDGGSPVVIRQGERGRLGLWQAGITKELLTAPRGASRLNLFMVRIEPGGTTGEDDYVHGGEEAGFVLEGRLDLHVEGRSWQLEPGDSFRFASDRPHRFGNDGDVPALVLWVNVTP
jgi:transcriptional regulator with XRE-family HTH domain